MEAVTALSFTPFPCSATLVGSGRDPMRAVIRLAAPLILNPNKMKRPLTELLSNLVFEGCWSCGDLVGVCGFDSVFERDAGDDLGAIIKAA